VPQLGGGTLNPPPTSVSATAVVFVVPAGAATGPITVATTLGSATSTASFTATPSTGFTLTATPPSANLIQGQSVSFAVPLASVNGFNQLAQLSVTGVPAGINRNRATATPGHSAAPAQRQASSALHMPGEAPVGKSRGLPTRSMEVRAAPLTLRTARPSPRNVNRKYRKLFDRPSRRPTSRLRRPRIDPLPGRVPPPPHRL
jgi:hypothetical protein